MSSSTALNVPKSAFSLTANASNKKCNNRQRLYSANIKTKSALSGGTFKHSQPIKAMIIEEDLAALNKNTSSISSQLFNNQTMEDPIHAANKIIKY
jgi:hypothetical protein